MGNIEQSTGSGMPSSPSQIHQQSSRDRGISPSSSDSVPPPSNFDHGSVVIPKSDQQRLYNRSGSKQAGISIFFRSNSATSSNIPKISGLFFPFTDGCCIIRQATAAVAINTQISQQ
ncbi:hypothetical protein ACLOJK_007810 [Asimina triloba]